MNVKPDSRGLDPAIHVPVVSDQKMDARIKSAHDERYYTPIIFIIAWCRSLSGLASSRDMAK